MVMKVASILSTSYSDNDFRDAILLADQRAAGSNVKKRRQLRLDLLGEAIGCNGEIVEEMGLVAEVCCQPAHSIKSVTNGIGSD